MRKKILAVILATIIALPVASEAALMRKKKVNSTTITGYVEYVIEGQVVFKTVDDQVLLLLGKKAANVATVKDKKIRIFGNVHAPSTNYPKGAISVRNFRVLDEPAPAQKEFEEVAPITEPEQNNPVEQPAENFSYSASQPEAYMEPEQVVDQIVRDAEQNHTPIVAEPASISDEQHPGPYTGAIVAEDGEKEKTVAVEDFQKYIVQPGDSLGKISSKIFGTTTRWKDIAHINGITNPKLLKVGMTLKIPVE